MSDDSSTSSQDSEESYNDDSLMITPDDQWTFLTRSRSESQTMEGLPHRVSGTLDLKYDPADAHLLHKAKLEIKNSLSQIRKTVFGFDSCQAITPFVAFAGVLPELFLRSFVKWLKTGQDVMSSDTDRPLRTSARVNRNDEWQEENCIITFEEIIEFIRCELKMRVLKISAAELKRCNVPSDSLAGFTKIRKAMTKADMPASKRSVPGGSNLPAFTFDPILNEGIRACNDHWRDTFFLLGVTWADLDDDKWPNVSRDWKAYGWRVTVAADKKPKPVMHTLACVGCGNIISLYPDKIGMKLSDMLRAAMNHLFISGENSLRSLFAMFIDRGYMELAKHQKISVTNLVQILQELNIKFLSTVKDSGSFPFEIVERIDDGNTVRNKRLLVQKYGMRTSFHARRVRNKQNIQASVMRHGKGKNRVARIATTIPECMGDTIVYETTVSKKRDRIPHTQAPPALPDGVSSKAVITHAWQCFESTLYSKSRTQRSDDWRVARIGTFSSTTFHVAVNVLSAPYFNTDQLQALHKEVLAIAQLYPRNEITQENAVDLEDGCLPNQRSSNYAGQSPARPGRHVNTSMQYWNNSRFKLQDLKEKCHELGINLPALRITKKLCSEYLVAHYTTVSTSNDNTSTTAQSTNETNVNTTGTATAVVANDINASCLVLNTAAPVGVSSTIASITPTVARTATINASLPTASTPGSHASATTDPPSASPSVASSTSDPRESRGTVEFEINQKVFLQRMSPHWFMKPLQTKTGGAIDQGVANESGIIKRLGKFVKELSKNRYEIQKVREFGLLTRRDCGVCSSSPDGIFPLLKRDTDGSYKFILLCVLEMKTRGSTNTVDALTREVENNGKWVECDAGTPLFRTSIPDAAYRSQVCQHAAALGLNKVMLVYSVPGAFVQRVVLVTVSDRQINTLVSLQKVLGETYLPFMSLDDDVPFVLPRLGDDFSPAYGYSQEHHTYHQWMWLARAYAKDVKEKGTPPSCRRFIDLLFSYWNKCMGNIDTIRKVVKEQKAKRGPNSGPGSLAWIHQFDYIFYQAMRVYQHSEIEKQLDRFETFKHLQETKKKACSYSAYLYMLASEDSLNAAHLNNVFPGLREFINRGPIVSIDNAVGGDSSALAVAEELPATTTRPATSYKQAIDFFYPNHVLYQKRVNKRLAHKRLSTTEKLREKNGGLRTARARCVMCCIRCDRHSKNPTAADHTRLGRNTVQYCEDCGVYLCRHCFHPFHASAVPVLSRCLAKKLPNSILSTARQGPEPAPNTTSPIKVMRRNRRKQV